MEHKIMTPETCKFKRIDPVGHHAYPCPVCDGGLNVCEVCGMAEADLLDNPECSGPLKSSFKSEREFVGIPVRQFEKTTATNDYLLTCVAEECSEICKEATKGIRFGLHDQWKEKPTAHDALIAEYYDLVAIMEMLFENKILCKLSEEEIVNMIEHKKHRVRHFMEYSAKRGHFKGDIV